MAPTGKARKGGKAAKSVNAPGGGDGGAPAPQGLGTGGTILAAVLAGISAWFAHKSLRRTPVPPGGDAAALASSAGDELPSGPSKFAGSDELWAVAGEPIGGEYLLQNVSCVQRPAQGLCGLPRRSGSCARFVIDDAVPESDAQELRLLVEWLVSEAWGGGSGPPSVVDLHQGSISYKEQFVELAALMDFKSISYAEAQKEAYHAVRRSLRATIARLLGLPEEAILHDMTFFSHINGTKEAKTVHDEYWHLHTDTEQYGTFEYTTLLYLSTQGKDFEGGEFVFEPSDSVGDGRRAVVEPRFNRLVVFTSDAENPHRVEKVSKGVRIALTAAFTCDPEKAASIGPGFPPKRPESDEADGAQTE